MGKSAPQPPSPPDPWATAAAQGAANVQTAIANAWLGNINTYNPLGSVEYKQIGTKTIPGQNNGGGGQGNGGGGNIGPINVPIFESVTRLSPNQMTLLRQQENLGMDLNRMALGQTRRIDDMLRLGPEQYTRGLPDFNRRDISVPILQTAKNLTPDLNRRYDTADLTMSLGNEDYETSRRRVEQALLSRINPDLDRDRAELEARMANQGITAGSEAWRNALTQHGRNVNDARMQAVLAGGQEQSRLFGMDTTRAQFANQAASQYDQQQQGLAAFENQTIQQNVQNRLLEAEHGNQIAQQQYQLRAADQQRENDLRGRMLEEMLRLRNQPINEISALMSGGQVTMPQFQPWNAPTVQPAPYAESIYRSAALEMQQYQAEMAQRNAMMGGLFGMGSSFLGALPFFSDPKLKKDKEKIGDLTDDIGLHLFRYKGEDSKSTPKRIGVMADEVEKVMPSAVFKFGKHKAVDYGQIIAAAAHQSAGG